MSDFGDFEINTFDNSVIKDKKEMKVFSKEEIHKYKKSFSNVKEMNKVVYFNLMKINNDFNMKKKDLDNSVKWSSVVYHTDNSKFNETNENQYLMNNWYFFSNTIYLKYDLDSFFDYMLVLDMVNKELFKNDSCIYINEYGFNNNKELMDKFGITDKFGSFEDLIETTLTNEDIYDNYFNAVIDWNSIKKDFENDRMLDMILENISNNDKKEFWVMKLGKLDRFINKKYQ